MDQSQLQIYFKVIKLVWFIRKFKQYKAEFERENFPYFDPNEVNFPCMYAGTFNVSLSDAFDHNLFYWFFKNTNLDTAPLVVWMNGGPGSSGLFGLFIENGPIKVKRTGTTDDDFLVYLSPQGSWNDIADVVYLDQPVGTGFSYGRTYIDRMETGADHFVSFLTQFLQMYPEYQTREVYIAGESYGGKYLPHFTYKVERFNDQNSQLPKDKQKPKINLQGTFIGDPFVSPIRQRLSTYLVARGLNIVDNSNMAQIAALRKQCEETSSNDWDKSSDVCELAMDYIDSLAGGVSTYDASQFDYDWSILEQPVFDFLGNSKQKGKLYTALHIDKSYKSPIYESSSQNVYEAYAYEEMIDWTSFYDRALQRKMRLIIYAGEYDQRDGPLTQMQWMKDLSRLDLTGGVFFNQARKIYYIKDKNNDFQVGGYYRSDPVVGFTFLTIPKAGHFVPATQLDVTKQMLQDFFQNKALVCHKDKPTDCDTAPIMCEAMNQCNGNGQCSAIDGKCQCNQGFKGADCQVQAEMMKDGYQKRFQFNGTQWAYFVFDSNLQENQHYELNFIAQNMMDIYVSAGANSEPTQFKNDMQFNKLSQFALDSMSFPQIQKFTVAVRVNGIDFATNTYQQHSMWVSFNVKTMATYIYSEKMALTESNSDVQIEDELVFDQNPQFENHQEMNSEQNSTTSHQTTYFGIELPKIDMKYILALIVVVAVVYFKRQLKTQSPNSGIASVVSNSKQMNSGISNDSLLPISVDLKQSTPLQ
ncbi:serine carboxypeptidase [Stylonychia lemnae]|uniref:Carboxypeptidase n=1 Tax=Stylonychia lemnae TaxID=5949 RepID=A0A077ZRH6_STYLE|nr:serine carboxypeptidase [Stylonychia lemnae]|eukprot:CDW71101.1 serine carboxypeptidase [Stylonychia lemnae]